MGSEIALMAFGLYSRLTYPEEQIKNAQKDGREDTQTQAHRFEKKQLERSDTAPCDGPKHRFVHVLDRCSPGRVTRVFSELDSLFAQEHRMVCLRH